MPRLHPSQVSPASWPRWTRMEVRMDPTTSGQFFPRILGLKQGRHVPRARVGRGCSPLSLPTDTHRGGEVSFHPQASASPDLKGNSKSQHILAGFMRRSDNLLLLWQCQGHWDTSLGPSDSPASDGGEPRDEDPSQAGKAGNQQVNIRQLGPCSCKKVATVTKTERLTTRFPLGHLG